MSAKSDTWMPFYIADYLRKTMHLTRDQHGGYMLLLMACWDRGGRLPNDPGQLAGIARATQAEWKKIAPVLLPFFDVDGDDLVQDRVIAEHEKAARLSAARRESGSKGGRPPKQTRSEQKPIGLRNGSQTETPLQEPIGSTLDSSETNVSSLSADKPARASASPKRSPESPIPAGYPDAEAVAEAEERVATARKALNVADHAKRFRNHALTNDRRVRDWPAAWRGWIDIEIEKALDAQPPQEAAPEFAWPGPAKIREVVAAKMLEPWTKAWLDPCEWDEDGAAIIAPRDFTVTKLEQNVKRELAKAGVQQVRVKGRAA